MKMNNQKNMETFHLINCDDETINVLLQVIRSVRLLEFE